MAKGYHINYFFKRWNFTCQCPVPWWRLENDGLTTVTFNHILNVEGKSFYAWTWRVTNAQGCLKLKYLFSRQYSYDVIPRIFILIPYITNHLRALCYLTIKDLVGACFQDASLHSSTADNRYLFFIENILYSNKLTFLIYNFTGALVSNVWYSPL